MKKIAVSLILLVSAFMSGCSAGREKMPATGVTLPTGVFREVPAGSPLPPGYVDLQIVSSLKTHRQGVYPLRKDAHGTADYELLLTIDGQEVRLKGVLTGENSEPGGLRDPEAGDGIRYAFRTVVRLKAGAHTVIVASPDDEVTATREITLAEGRSYTLELEPVYGTTAQRQRPAYYGLTSFLEGVRGFRIMLSEGFFSENP